jgi:hypothetical protein
MPERKLEGRLRDRSSGRRWPTFNQRHRSNKPMTTCPFREPRGPPSAALGSRPFSWDGSYTVLYGSTRTNLSKKENFFRFGTI